MTGERVSAARMAMVAGLAAWAVSCAGVARGEGEGALDDAWLNARVADLGDTQYAVRERANDDINERIAKWAEEAKAEVGADATLTDGERELKVREVVEARSRAWLDAIEVRLAGGIGSAAEDGSAAASRPGGNVSTPAPLNMEQRERLAQIGSRLFSRMPHGAMGVSFSRLDRGQGVEIASVIAGFDSQRVLQPGDVVLEIDGHSVLAQNDVRAAIVSHDPGDKVDMVLMRRGERVVVALTLGDFDALRNAAIPDRSLMRSAFELRVARRAGVAPRAERVIEPGMDSVQWATLQLNQNERLAGAAQQARGRGLDTTDDEDEGKMAGIAAGGGDRLANGGDAGFLANPPGGDPNQIETLNARRQQLQQQIVGLRRRLLQVRDPALKMAISNQMRMIQSQMTEVDQALNRAGVVRPNVAPGVPVLRP